MTIRSAKKVINKHILIVSDSTDEIKNIQHLLAEDFGSCLKADNVPEGLKLFHDHHPSVLVLTFKRIEGAEHFYLCLYKQGNQIHTIPHQTLLLCTSKESSKAYQLCRSGTFDDYIADRPLLDPLRLLLSVAQALERHSEVHYAQVLNHKIENITGDLIRFNEFIGSKISSGDGQHQETIHRFQIFTQHLTTSLYQLEENLIGNSGAGDRQKMDPKKISDQFEQFRNTSLQKGSQELAKQMHKTHNWLEELDHGYKDFVEKVQQESDAVHVEEIMLVDDDEFFRNTLAAMLQEAGMHILEIGDGKTALAKLQRCKPKLILLDYNMPGVNGIETLKQIKSSPNSKSIPVIMLTGVSDREIVQQCISAGATDFIVKPSERSAILCKIDGALKR